MKLFKCISRAFQSRPGAYIFFALAVAAFTFFYSASWAYGWIAELYPLGRAFVPVFFCVAGLCAAITLWFFLLSETRKARVLRAMYLAACVLTGALFIYTFVLLFSLDQGFSAWGCWHGLNSLVPHLPWLGMALLLPLAAARGESRKKSLQAALASALVVVLVISPAMLSRGSVDFSTDAGNFLPMQLQSQNILEEFDEVWAAQRRPGYNNDILEIELPQTSTFNTAIIEEVGNQAQYFRLQAMVDGEWFTFYQSEKIQAMRLCSFDPVTTDRVRLSIDKFRSDDTPVRIKSLQLYNEPARNAGNFEVAAYQRIDHHGDIPTQVLAKGEEFVKTYARYYDVYSTVIVFAAVFWDENGSISFGDLGEEGFARELAALKEIISHRSNQDHQVKVVVTTLADGVWEDGHTGVNYYMHEHWKSVAGQTIAFVEKYDLDGVDIDWEYPQNAGDWRLFDRFIECLDDGMKAIKPDAILSGAFSAWGLGMSEEVLRRFDQIQYMAYDGADIDGLQSTLQQAQEGLLDFINNGAELSRINIGIAAYGRPLNSTPFWAIWRDLEQANYWQNKYYNIPDSGQIYDGAFVSPALAGDKTAYALFCGAGGAMVFRVACDKLMDDPNSVTIGIENVLKRYAAEW